MTMHSILDLHVPDKIRDTTRSANFRDLALVGARLGLGWLFIYHGSSTLFGAFHGAGLHRTAVFFADYAHLHPGMFFACLNGITEFFGGIAIALGVFARLAAFGLIVDMVIAMITVTWHNGIVSNAVGSGYEINIALACLAIVVASLGSGRLALDYQFKRLVGRAPAPNRA
jgi:putative oxidoreductase